MNPEILSIGDAFFRFSGITLFLLMVLVTIRDVKDRLAAVLACWSALSGAAYMVCTSDPVRESLGPFTAIIIPFCLLGQVAIWLFSLWLFRDGFRIGAFHVGVGVLYIGLNQALFNFLDEGTLVWTAVSGVFAALRFSLIAHMLLVAWQGRDDDLIENRRRFRVVYILVVSAIAGTIALIETWFTPYEDSIWLSFAMWLVSVLLIWRVLAIRDVAIFSTSGPQTNAVPKDSDERHDLAVIERLIKQDKMYLQAGLTIAGLAGQAGLPEHRLRRLINQHLGYRNFADFLNHYRINAAKEQLSSIEKRNVPVLTIAMDLGYGSLGPFNRAFKERTGLTPTAFRKKRLADS